MGVYIKGMEMPRSCANCEWSKLSKMDLGMSCFCTLVKKIGSLEIAKNNRMDFCPLVPVPPHGRLIDADALTFSPSEFWGFQATDNAKSAEAIVNAAPTTIPAEEGE